MKMTKKQNNTVSKPLPFIAPGSEKKITPEEMKKRKKKFERLEPLDENVHNKIKDDNNHPF